MRWLVLVVAGCGRVAFDPLADAPPVVDDVPPAAITNRAFVTSQTFNGNLGGLAGADAKCAAAAANAHRDGTFLALLSDNTTSTVFDRVTGSMGWTRVDGLPLFNTPNGATIGGMYNPLDLDENGIQVAATPGVFTGTENTGGFNCTSWTDGTAGGVAAYGDATSASQDFLNVATAVGQCDQPFRLYCLEVGHQSSVHPPGMPAGRRLFITGGGPVGPTASDAACQTAADGAMLGGTFTAAVASTTQTIASRFTSDARPVERLDGTVVAANLDELFTASELQSFAYETPAFYIDNALFWTGAASPTSLATPASSCNGWTSTVSTDSAIGGVPVSVMAARFWGGVPGLGCDSTAFVLCIEQ